MEAQQHGAHAGSFSQPGLGGREGEVKELGVWGGNPSVTWNAYLERWLMVYPPWHPESRTLKHMHQEGTMRACVHIATLPSMCTELH